MTGFIYICKLRNLESNIQQSIYRVDQSAPATEPEVERFIQQLEDWKARCVLKNCKGDNRANRRQHANRCWVHEPRSHDS